jgi:hypothetical protein
MSQSEPRTPEITLSGGRVRSAPITRGSTKRRASSSRGTASAAAGAARAQCCARSRRLPRAAARRPPRRRGRSRPARRWLACSLTALRVPAAPSLEHRHDAVECLGLALAGDEALPGALTISAASRRFVREALQGLAVARDEDEQALACARAQVSGACDQTDGDRPFHASSKCWTQGPAPLSVQNAIHNLLRSM